MIIVIGLGNIGEKYQRNRHNIGFQILDIVAEKAQATFEHEALFHALIAKTPDYIFAKPTTFMNESGKAAHMLRKQYPDALIAVVYDEINIPIGEIKCSFDRGDGGHNGVASVIDHLGTKSFFRIRAGIRPVDESLLPRIAPPNGFETFMLSDFTPIEEEKRREGIAKACAVIESLSYKTLPELMTEFN